MEDLYLSFNRQVRNWSFACFVQFDDASDPVGVSSLRSILYGRTSFLFGRTFVDSILRKGLCNEVIREMVLKLPIRCHDASEPRTSDVRGPFTNDDILKMA
jgi:hypothetical protein